MPEVRFTKPDTLPSGGGCEQFSISFGATSLKANRGQ
jgi:hypothetical protein